MSVNGALYCQLASIPWDTCGGVHGLFRCDAKHSSRYGTSQSRVRPRARRLASYAANSGLFAMDLIS
jgi:hypothetical protein